MAYDGFLRGIEKENKKLLFSIFLTIRSIDKERKYTLSLLREYFPLYFI